MRSLFLAFLTGIALLVVPGAAAAASGEVRVEIGAVDLDGPAVSTVAVTVVNAGDTRMTRVNVAFTGPVGWTSYPASQAVSTAVTPGSSATVRFQIHVPERPPGFTVRVFKASATYRGGDGAGTASGTRVERSGTPLPNLAAAFNNVGVTDETNVAPGNFDGEGNSFSAQKLAAVGVVRGGSVSALGATLTWPASAAGTPDNAAGGAKTIELPGRGSKLVFLGSGAGLAAVDKVTVWYSDGTTATGQVGFPNWSFQAPDTYGATLVAASQGRNTPAGYANAQYQYRVFANSVALDPAKTVELVTLPGAGSVHVFAVGFAG